MVGSADRRWLILVANVAAGFLVLGRFRGAWAESPLGVSGPYLLWLGLVAIALLVAGLWSDSEPT
ncbi:MAG: hypothetical protein AAF211_16525 [Myxococcota bacterium]